MTLLVDWRNCSFNHEVSNGLPKLFLCLFPQPHYFHSHRVDNDKWRELCDYALELCILLQTENYSVEWLDISALHRTWRKVPMLIKCSSCRKVRSMVYLGLEGNDFHRWQCPCGKVNLFLTISARLRWLYYTLWS